MPFLADLDQPPRSRIPGLLIGLVIAVPVTLLFLGWLLPTLVGAVLGGAQDLDVRLREQDRYMKVLCSTAFEPQRDEALCSCVLGTEYPALDCQGPYRSWALEVQLDRCGDEQTHQAALSFCTCVEAVHEAVLAAAEDKRMGAAQAYERCEVLDDAIVLPQLELAE